jgi:polysaccharide biosynthesis protein PslH
MKILMIVPFLPNTSRSGGQTRWYNIIKYLSQSHEITLFSLIKHESEKKFIPELEKYCKKVRVFNRPRSPWTLRNLFFTAVTPYPLLVIRNFSFEERRAIKKELETDKYDIIHAETFYVMPHIPNTKVPSIMVEQTIEYQVYKHFVDTELPWFLRPIFMIDVIKLRFWELYFWKKTNRLVSVSDNDREIMKKLIPGIGADVIPNGVDTDYYLAKKVAKVSPPRVLYGVTNFEWLQNVEAVNVLVHDVWPLIHKKVPQAKLWIVGRMIPKWLVDIAAERSDIEITESIEDPRDAYGSATLMVTPIRGEGGTRLKVLEAMAAGLPIVSTSVGVAGLKLTPGKHALVSETSEGMAAEAVKLLNDPGLSQAIGKAAQNFVKENFDWKAIVKLHDKIYAKAMKNI